MLPGFINLEHFLSPGANGVAALSDLGDSIQHDRIANQQDATSRASIAAQTETARQQIAAENARAQATIQATAQRQQADFAQKRQEQRAAAVKEFTDSVLAADLARVEASAPYLAAHGVRLEQGEPATASADLPAMDAVDQAMAAAPGPGAEPPAPRHVIKLRTEDGQDLGDIDLGAIGEQRSAAIRPVLERLLKGAAPRDRQAYSQQVNAALQSPAMMAMGAPKLVEQINKGAQPNAEQAHADYRAGVMANAQNQRAGANLDLATWRQVNLVSRDIVGKAIGRSGIRQLVQNEQAASKVDAMLRASPQLKTGAGDFEALEAQVRQLAGGRIGPELIEATLKRGGFESEAGRALGYFFNGGKLPAAYRHDLIKASQIMTGLVHQQRVEAAAAARRDALQNPFLGQYLTPELLREQADNIASQVGGLNQADLDYIQALEGSGEVEGADAAP